MTNPGRVRLHADDNVEVSIDPDDELRGHKFALLPIETGAPIVKLGQQIGRASAAIAVGEHLHTHNVEPAREPAMSDEDWRPKSDFALLAD